MRRHVFETEYSIKLCDYLFSGFGTGGEILIIIREHLGAALI